jgi:hypothetical protein
MRQRGMPHARRGLVRYTRAELDDQPRLPRDAVIDHEVVRARRGDDDLATINFDVEVAIVRLATRNGSRARLSPSGLGVTSGQSSKIFSRTKSSLTFSKRERAICSSLVVGSFDYGDGANDCFHHTKVTYAKAIAAIMISRTI